jgi:hypothetical protein
MAEVLGEVCRLNELLRYVAFEVGLDHRLHAEMLVAVRAHSAYQNLSGEIGLGGAVISILNALQESGIDIADIAPGAFGQHGFANGSPEEFYKRYRANPRQWRPTAFLLRNGRAVLFKADPDIAILQPLGPPFANANDAVSRYEAVRRDLARRRMVFHEFAVGEVKTALDPSNLHERIALAGREIQAEIRAERFLVMSVLPSELMVPTGAVNRRQQSIVDSLGSTWSNIFNLYFVWNYDGVQASHLNHWDRFKQHVKERCEGPSSRH